MQPEFFQNATVDKVDSVDVGDSDHSVRGALRASSSIAIVEFSSISLRSWEISPRTRSVTVVANGLSFLLARVSRSQVPHSALFHCSVRKCLIVLYFGVVKGQIFLRLREYLRSLYFVVAISTIFLLPRTSRMRNFVLLRCSHGSKFSSRSRVRMLDAVSVVATCSIFLLARARKCLILLSPAATTPSVIHRHTLSHCRTQALA